MKKLSLYIFLVLMWCNVGFADEIDYKKTILNNKIIGIYNDTGKHEWVFNKDGTAQWEIIHLASMTNIGSYKKCWTQTEFNEDAFKYRECSSLETDGMLNFDFINMTLRLRTSNDDLIYKLIEPIKIFYK